MRQTKKQWLAERIKRDTEARIARDARRPKTPFPMNADSEQENFELSLKGRGQVLRFSPPACWTEFEEIVREELWSFLGPLEKKGLGVLKRVYHENHDIPRAAALEGVGPRIASECLGKFCNVMDQVLPPEVKAGLPADLRGALQDKQETETRQQPPPNRCMYINPVAPAAVSDEAFEKIIKQAKGYIAYIKRKYWVYGFDNDDIEQECLIGLNSAIRHYNPAYPFLPFAQLVMKRRIFNLIKAANFQCRNARVRTTGAYFSQQAERYGACFGGDDSLHAVEELPRNAVDTSRLWLSMSQVGTLTHKERTTIRLLARGDSYSRIAAQMRTDEKSVDNSLQRAKRKLRLAWAGSSRINGAKKMGELYVGRPVCPFRDKKPKQKNSGKLGRPRLTQRGK
jgi:RNA polymerase sporulation-specific sigma factor